MHVTKAELNPAKPEVNRKPEVAAEALTDLRNELHAVTQPRLSTRLGLSVCVCLDSSFRTK